MLHHYLNSHASVCVFHPPSPLPQRTQRPWTRPRDHLRERGDPLCYVSAREWNNTESSSANNSQWRSFSTCRLTKGKIRTDDILSDSLGVCGSALLCSYTPQFVHFAPLVPCAASPALTPLVALSTGWYGVQVLVSNRHRRGVSHFFVPSTLAEVKRGWRNPILDLMIKH